MSNRLGGRLSLLFGYRPLVAILVCANILVAGIAAHEILPKVSAILPGRAPAGSTPVYGACGQTPSTLAATPISVKHPGLSQVASGPFYYAVSGVTPQQINSNMAACSVASPGASGEFAADTAYVINWQTTYKTAGNGQCKTDKVAVGLTTRHTYPNWADPAAPAATATTWNTFIRQLHIHEEGHVALDQQYAARILQSLQTLPAASCHTIGLQVDTAAKAIVRTLDQANKDYDTTTGHGQTQGAILQ
jgi:predicted secreted Zn-dependent protease